VSAVTAAFSLLFVTTGVNFAFGILFKPILSEFGWERSSLALAVTASLGVNALGQPLFGAVIDRFGPRRVILASMTVMAAGTALVALARTPWQVVLLYGVVAAIGYTGCGILPVSVHVSRWFPGERGFVMAMTACGFSLGHLAFTQVAAHAALAFGWRRTYVLLAGVLAVTWAVMAAWLRDAPQPAAGAAGAGAPGGGLDRRAAHRTAGFWCLTGAMVGCGFTDFVLTTHLAPFATDLGLSPAVAANAVSLLAAANVAGILVAGTIAARLGARWALVGVFALRAASLFFLASVRETWQLYLFSVFFGATFFTTAPLSSTLVGELFGACHHGAIFGSVNLFHHLAGGLGAWAGGLTFDLAGSYRPIFLASGAVVAASALVGALARPARRAAGR
jgi:MFS family permease